MQQIVEDAPSPIINAPDVSQHRFRGLFRNFRDKGSKKQDEQRRSGDESRVRLLFALEPSDA
jgi:hypothetical protein